jgi:hypothetical protein
MVQFSEKDLQQLEEKGITREKVLKQIDTFKEGIPFVTLEKAAVVGNGIERFTEAEQKKRVDYFEKHRDRLKLLKFVPASGAASRMFKAMFNFLDAHDPKRETLTEYVERTNDEAVKKFAEGIEKFPFYEKIMDRIEGKYHSQGEQVYYFVKEMLSTDGLDYGFYPKGLLPFHKYGKDTATPFEEHLKEAALYAKTDGVANLHFTISEQHDEMFRAEEKRVAERVSKSTQTTFKVGYSNQKSSTDTIAVDLNDEPFRNNDGTLLFRPGGHGALIENLNDQQADIIFIKNIDNVVVDRNLEAVANSKKMLAGVLLQVQSEAFSFAEKLDDETVSIDVMAEAKDFLEKRLNVRFQENYRGLSIDDQRAILKDKLNRPIRVCGMVKNEGEPGGGPFWIKDKNGNISLQIIESAQVDMGNGHQVSILKNSTHFNPVDLVCGVKNHKGEKYNLLNYVDAKQGFITEKTKEGKPLKALELPGLWNGAMAYWNTIFVEVPLVTFNPVKTVNDLLKPSHQV